MRIADLPSVGFVLFLCLLLGYEGKRSNSINGQATSSPSFTESAAKSMGAQDQENATISHESSHIQDQSNFQINPKGIRGITDGDGTTALHESGHIQGASHTQR
jgi:hypothetical protein